MKKAIIILALLILPAQVCSQYEPPIEFTKPLETPHFTIYYREDHARPCQIWGCLQFRAAGEMIKS